MTGAISCDGFSTASLDRSSHAANSLYSDPRAHSKWWVRRDDRPDWHPVAEGAAGRLFRQERCL